MIVGIAAFIAGVICIIYSIFQFVKARRLVYLNMLSAEYNLWGILGLFGVTVFMVIAAMAFRAVYLNNTHISERIAEIEQCNKMERVWPGRMLFTDHCYFEMGNGIYMMHAGDATKLYTKEEVLARKP
ncbi:hypothetical protein pEaSNUABM37_00096 [Erwinia phage pEa_SNUABM_37]|nr:hypothetical protein pEaSNUABM37_00096 [Erwinia phage pEa_SNUABM_37]QXO10566.1 hypothetical protein pEaSNUABM48_00096 [Erwinia phage pEa_SNUABM_48]